MKRLPIIASFFLFIALCVSIAYWALQLFKPPARPVAAPPQTVRQDVRLDAASTLFGGRTAPVAVASNYQLKGVVMAGNAYESIAILSADGKPPLTTRVNKEVQPGVVVKEVHPTYVLLSEGGVSKRVELPEGARNPSGGVLSAGPGNPGAGGPPGMSGGNVQSLAPPPMPGAPNPGIAGAPPVMQSGETPPTTLPNNGVIGIPPPPPRQ